MGRAQTTHALSFPCGSLPDANTRRAVDGSRAGRLNLSSERRRDPGQ